MFNKVMEASKASKASNGSSAWADRIPSAQWVQVFFVSVQL
jgi:hypothetical protein